MILQTAFAQKYTLNGYVREKSTGEDLLGATIYIEELHNGTVSNAYGFYSLTLPKGKYNITVSFIGFSKFHKLVELNKNTSLNFDLENVSITTEEVLVIADRTDKNVKNTRTGTIKLGMKKITELPAFMGEVDILKTIQLLPGVQSAGEGNAGFYVRGGGPDQNLILLDEAVVYNSSHLFGFFSVFNADAIQSVQLTKGGMPANYGGRLSSVLDISMKNGNNQRFQVSGGIGLISSRLTVQGPILKGKTSFIVSGRRTYIDILSKPLINKSSKFSGSGYYFYDLNAKVNHRFSDKDRLFISGYFGRDVFSFVNKDSNFDIKIPWGNSTLSLRWNHLFNSKLFMNSTLVYSNYEFQFDAIQNDFDFKLFSGITDYNAKVDFDYEPSVAHHIKFGINYTAHTFVPSSVSGRVGETEFDTEDIGRLHANDAAIYLNEEIDIFEKLRVNIGLRATYFQQIGPFTRFVKDENGKTTDSLFYGTNENVQTYYGLEPRFSARYTLSETSSLKASYTRNVQYINLANISSLSLPTDTWVPASSVVKPQLATQYVLGYFKNFKENTYESSIELYYKQMDNQIAYKEGAIPGDNLANNADNNFTFGEGNSYGVELFVKKRYGQFTGWIGYTLSKTTRKFEDINFGKEFPAKYDRRHDLSVVLTYQLNKKWTFSTIFVYATGNALTLQTSRYLIDNQIIGEYGERNSHRMAAYHRLDLSATYMVKKTAKFESSWNFSIYNVYNRYNPYFIYFDTEGDIPSGTFKATAKQVSLFPILPSVAWNFKF